MWMLRLKPCRNAPFLNRGSLPPTPGYATSRRSSLVGVGGWVGVKDRGWRE